MAKNNIEIVSAGPARVSALAGSEAEPVDTARALCAADRTKAVEGLIALAEDGAFAALLQPGAEKLMWG
jgi:hypothetical protein